MYYTCPCASGRHGYRMVPPRNAICPHSGLWESATRMCECVCVSGLKIFFGGHSRIKPLLLSVVWRAKGQATRARVAKISSNFSSPFYSSETSRNEVDFCSPYVRNVATHTHLRNRRRGRVINGTKVWTRVYFSIREPSGSISVDGWCTVLLPSVIRSIAIHGTKGRWLPPVSHQLVTSEKIS